MSTAIVYVILFSLLTVMVIGSSKARFLALFAGIVIFPLGVSFLQSPTVRPQDLFLYGFLFVVCLKERQYIWDDFKAFAELLTGADLPPEAVKEAYEMAETVTFGNRYMRKDIGARALAAL